MTRRDKWRYDPPGERPGRLRLEKEARPCGGIPLGALVTESRPTAIFRLLKALSPGGQERRDGR